jgi:hypothetical protein
MTDTKSKSTTRTAVSKTEVNVKAPQNLPEHSSKLLQEVFGLAKNLTENDKIKEKARIARLPKDQ